MGSLSFKFDFMPLTITVQNDNPRCDFALYFHYNCVRFHGFNTF